MTLRHGVWARTPGPGGGEQWRGAARAEAAHPQAEEGGEGEHQEPGEAGAGAGPHRHQQRQPRHRTRNRSDFQLKTWETLTKEFHTTPNSHDNRFNL